MWLSRVWSKRHESHKEQNKAFKLLKLFLSKETKLFKKEKKKRNITKLTQEDEAKKKKKMKNNELQIDTAWRSL